MLLFHSSISLLLGWRRSSLGVLSVLCEFFASLLRFMLWQISADVFVNSLGAVYEAGNFRMSTWIPIIWGGINVLVLILSSFPMQGGL